jgi:hypothetical protein
MLKRFLCTSILIIISINTLFSQQEALDVTDQTLKIAANTEESLYFAFAEGDKIVFNFSEINKKELKEVEITEYPSTSKFSDYKSIKIENKIIQVNKKGIYRFRFYNGNLLSGRICKIKIQRIPAGENTANFVTNVKWIIKQDTTWNTYTKDVIVGYDTIYEQKTKKELVKTETKEEVIFDKSQRVHSYWNSNGNKANLFFSIPQNQISEYKVSKIIAWAYWVGVDKAGEKAWQENTENMKKLASGVASIYLTPLGALAAGAITSMIIPSSGEDVIYSVADNVNKDYFMSGYEYKVYDSGKGVAGYRKFTDPAFCKGTYFILLKNDNEVTPIDVNVKVSVIIETNIYEDKTYTETKISPKHEKQIFQDPVIKKVRLPIME